MLSWFTAFLCCSSVYRFLFVFVRFYYLPSHTVALALAFDPSQCVVLIASAIGNIGLLRSVKPRCSMYLQVSEGVAVTFCLKYIMTVLSTLLPFTLVKTKFSNDSSLDTVLDVFDPVHV